jgi:hypothetical protein
MPGIDFRQFRQAISMTAVLNLLGFVPRWRCGVQVRGSCPLQCGGHGTSVARAFSANLAGHKFQCFHCGACGNQLDLWAKARQQTLYEAALDLCGRLGRAVPWLSRGTEKRNP